MLKTIAALTGAILIAGCGGEAVPSANEAMAADNAAAINYQAAVLGLGDGERDVVMIRAIRDAGIECQQVTRSERAKGEGLTYRARCADGASHIVSIAADGNAKVVSAAAAKR